MTRHLATCLLVAALSIVSPRAAPAEAFLEIPYETVDAFEVSSKNITVTGIIAGAGAPTTTQYTVLTDVVAASRCDRLALLAMSRPGKFQFVVVSFGFSGVACKLVARAP